jgi:predicted amidohydrolase YtcJ
VESGGTIAFGSDWSVSTANPFPQIEVAVTRADPTGDVEGTLVPEQAITLEEAIVAFTINAAFVNRLDKESGSLEVGKSADLAVLDRNLFEVDPQDISETRVILTMLEGEVVYEAETGTK